MNVQKVRQKISVAKLHDDERSRSALARIKAQMAMNGDLRLERQVNTIVELVTGVRL